MQDALEHSGQALIERLVVLAGDGNTGAMRQCLDRLMGKHRPSAVTLPAPDSPDYVIKALTEIHRALGAGEIASDEAARLVDLVGRTARVLAMKAVAEIDFAERLAQVEEAVVALLKAGTPARAAAATTGPAGDEGAETMPAAPAEPAQPGATAPADLGVIDNNNGNTMSEVPAPDDKRPAAGEDGTDQAMNSAGPPAPLAVAA